MQAGGIVETGTHQQLLAAGGMYAQLYRSTDNGLIGDDAS
jgi:ABC-type transport system involved in Fe-S cluster assembly fused permease/ATPase subunit